MFTNDPKPSRRSKVSVQVQNPRLCPSMPHVSVVHCLLYLGLILKVRRMERSWGGVGESVTNDVTETNHIWLPSAVEKDQDSEALAGLMGIIYLWKVGQFWRNRDRKQPGFYWIINVTHTNSK